MGMLRIADRYKGYSRFSAMEQAMEFAKQQWIVEKLSAVRIDQLTTVDPSDLETWGISNPNELDERLKTLDISEVQRCSIRHELDAWKETFRDEYVSVLGLTLRFKKR